MCGDRLGQGVAREVYVFKPDPTLVIKFELTTHDFQNVNEWEVWESAPCVGRKVAGPCGGHLRQRNDPFAEAYGPPSDAT